MGSEPGRRAAAVPARKMRRPCVVLAAFALSVAASAPAGPPFLTDDPEPVELGHWEAYLFAMYDGAPSTTAVDGPAFELNYGAAPNLQLHLVVPLTTAEPAGGPSAHGLGDLEVGVKYRFVEESEGQPQIGIFPMLELPTGNDRRGLGNGRLWARLPIWAQKSWGPWTSYGGGGYVVNTAPAARSYAFGGWFVQRQVSSRLTLGVEAYARGADAAGGRGVSILNGGGMIDLGHGFSVLFSGGHSVAGEHHGVAYLGLYWTGGGSGRPDASARAVAGPQPSLVRLPGGAR